MGYQLTEDQTLIRNMVREFAENEVKPIAAEIDKNHRFPTETVKRMAELGLFGLSTPEALGGGGDSAEDVLSYILAVEELSRVCATHGVILSAHVSLGMYQIGRAHV